MDDVFLRIRGQYRYLWRAIDQDGAVVDVLLQERRDAASAGRFFGHLVARLGGELRTIVTDNWEVTRLPAASCCRALRTTPVDTRTIGPNCRISRPGYENGA